MLKAKNYNPMVCNNALHLLLREEFTYDCFIVTRICLQEAGKKQKFFEFDTKKRKWKGIGTKSLMANRLYCCVCEQTAFLCFFSIEYTLDTLVQVGLVRKPDNHLEAVASKCYEQQFIEQYRQYSRYHSTSKRT